MEVDKCYVLLCLAVLSSSAVNGSGLDLFMAKHEKEIQDYSNSASDHNSQPLPAVIEFLNRRLALIRIKVRLFVANILKRFIFDCSSSAWLECAARCQINIAGGTQ